MRRIAALLIALAALATPAQAQRALLIGVDYPDLPPSLQLAAPQEDAERVAAALTGAGLAKGAVTLLTAQRGDPPTRARVLAALAALARDAQPGEPVLVYFSGHGAQAPTATPGLEPDGLDELYLTRDARGWDGGEGAVSGAILDKEMARALDEIRVRGADVWFVADACHAGGLFRGAAEPGARLKAVPAARGAVALPDSPPAVRATPTGRLAAFYAAAPGAFAVERRLPPGSPDARPLSQFSYALVRALGSGRLRSLRDLSLALADAAQGLPGSAPEPLFEGVLDMPVLDLPPDRPRRFALERVGGRWVLGAGVEEGLAGGDRVAIEGHAQAVVRTVGMGRSEIDAPELPPGRYVAAPVLARADGPAALLAALPGLEAQGEARSLRVSAKLWHPGASLRCPRLGEAPKAPSRVDALRLPDLRQCDVLLIDVVNDGAAAIDLSTIHIDAAGKAIALGYGVAKPARVPPGEQRRIALRIRTSGEDGAVLAAGVERLILVALPGIGPVRDLRGAFAAGWRGGAETGLDEGAGALTIRWRSVR